MLSFSYHSQHHYVSSYTTHTYPSITLSLPEAHLEAFKVIWLFTSSRYRSHCRGFKSVMANYCNIRPLKRLE